MTTLKNLLESTDLFASLDDQLIANLVEAFMAITIDAGDLLIRSGESSEDLYLVESGSLQVLLNDANRQDKVVAEIGPGESIGEMALLTGALRSATIRAKEPSRLWQITRHSFEQIAQDSPSLRATVEEAARGKIHQANLRSALYANQIFGKMDAHALQDLEAEIELLPLSAATRLIQQGQPSDSLYLIVSGQLRILVESDNAEPKYHQDLGRGQTVGEIGLLTGNPRSASVYAVRDSLVGRLSEDAYYQLLQKHPKTLTRLFSTQVMTELAQRSHAPELSDSPVIEQYAKPAQKRAKTFALVAFNPGAKENGPQRTIAIDQFAERLVYHLTHPWAKQKSTSDEPSAFYINVERTDYALDESGIGYAPIDSAAHIRLQNWFNEQESSHDYLIYGGTTSGKPSAQVDGHSFLVDEESIWTERILQQVDHVLYLAWADSEPANLRLPRREQNESAKAASTPSHMLQPKRSLILLHPEDCAMPSGTQRWLETISVDTYHHVRWANAGGCEKQDPIMNDLGRLARLITDNGIALVLSGGAVRGLAQSGVIRALREAQVPIDLIGGASAGALSGAIMASGYSDDGFRKLIMETAKRKNMNDYTLPLTSFFAGKRYTETIKSYFGDLRIEDLWQPYFCVTIDLGTATEVVHREGPLWRYTRASSSLPVALPPVSDGGRLLADGAILNYLPVEIMRQTAGCGTIIGVDVSGGTGMRGEYKYGTALSGWRQFVRRMNPFAKPYRAPSLPHMIIALGAIGAVGRVPQQRAQVDLLIRPPVQLFGMMEYEKRAEIINVGYEAGQTAIDHWLTSVR